MIMSDINGSLPCCPERSVVVVRIVIADVDAKNMQNIARSKLKLLENAPRVIWQYELSCNLNDIPIRD